jgi:hypothetical protein
MPGRSRAQHYDLPGSHDYVLGITEAFAVHESVYVLYGSPPGKCIIATKENESWLKSGLAPRLEVGAAR